MYIFVNECLRLRAEIEYKLVLNRRLTVEVINKSGMILSHYSHIIFSTIEGKYREQFYTQYFEMS